MFFFLIWFGWIFINVKREKKIWQQQWNLCMCRCVSERVKYKQPSRYNDYILWVEHNTKKKNED
jgi:hypothetical protein